MNGKLAVLIPAFNGGELLRRTVASCARIGLDSRYSIILIDNCSTDGSLAGLDNLARIYRNERNLGRVANWNRALEIAQTAGFTYATFLFVGDEWVRNDAVAGMLDSMDRNQSVFGMASLRIVDPRGALLRVGARLTIRGAAAQVSSQHLLNHAIGGGRLPFAPLQANVYRLFADRPLRFNTAAENSLNADIEATVEFLRNHPGGVSIHSESWLCWRERAGRFFSDQDPWAVLIATRRTLQRMSALTGVPVDWKNANAVAFLVSWREPSRLIPWRQRCKFRLRALRFLLKDPGGLSPARVARIIAKKLLLGRSYLDLSGQAIPGQAAAQLQTIAD